jgi:peptidoglycan hydrolase CwlO-like protein
MSELKEMDFYRELERVRIAFQKELDSKQIDIDILKEENKKLVQKLEDLEGELEEFDNELDDLWDEIDNLNDEPPVRWRSLTETLHPEGRAELFL